MSTIEQPSTGSSWASGLRPITIAILAMGGEGGGALANWITAVAEKSGMHAQNTSVAGVAQRTGATVYYIELYPESARPDSSVRSEPVLSLFPTPGEVDIVIASELMEAARSVARGFTTPDRTMLITSTNRVYSMIEKMAPGDGRVDDEALWESAQAGARTLIADDFSQIATDHRSVISASLFGALAASGAMPFARDDYETAIVESGKGVIASLAAFAAGFDAAQAAPAPPPASSIAVPVSLSPRRPKHGPGEEEEAARQAAIESDPMSLVGPELQMQAKRVMGDEFPAPARSMLLHGIVRTAVYQNEAYADRYLDRVAAVAALDNDDAQLTIEAARHVALWMCYQDTIQVAMQKLRRTRMAKVRSDAGADDSQLVNVYEYLHPQLEEVTDTMPIKLGARLRRSRGFGWLVGRIAGDGLVINTTGTRGFISLWATAKLRPMRPRTLRFGHEQAGLDQWLTAVLDAAGTDVELAKQIVLCEGVRKGYGETHHRGAALFERLLAHLPNLTAPTAADDLATLRKAALADEDGVALDAALTEMSS